MVEDELLALGQGGQYHLQKVVEALVLLWHHWPGDQRGVLALVRLQTKYGACSSGDLDCLQPKPSLYHKAKFQN